MTNKHKEELENLKNELTRQHDEKLQHYSELLHAKELEVIIDREAREIMYLVASVRPFVCQFVCPTSPA